MVSLIPAKRGSSPAPVEPLASTSASISATRRADANQGRGLHTRQGMRGMPGSWENFINNVWEGEDFEASLLALEGMIGSMYLPSPEHIHQLLALALSPISCLPPTHAKLLATSNLDPLVPTARKIRSQALHLLEHLAGTISAEAVFRAVPGYVADPTFLQESFPSAQDYSTVQISEVVKGKRPYHLPPLVRHPKINDDDEDDSALLMAGKRIARCEDLWTILGAAGNSNGSPPSPEGWELLRTFAGMWEEEVKLRASWGMSALSNSFLGYCKVVDVVPRSIPAKVFKIIFWPFEHAETEESSGEDDHVAEGEELETYDKQRLSARLTTLLAQLSDAGKLEPTAFLREMASQMKSLTPACYEIFLDALNSCPPLFTIRLAAFYLEFYSQASTRPPQASTQPRNSSPRRRALGDSTSMSSLTLSQSSASQVFSSPSSQVVNPVRPTHNFQLPDRSDVLQLLAKIPSNFPPPMTIPLSGISSTTPQLPTTPLKPDVKALRVPKARANRPSEFQASLASLQSSSRSHLLMKQVLIEAVLQVDAKLDIDCRRFDGDFEERAEETLRKVDSIVQEAKKGAT